MANSLPRQNFHADSEAAINRQINLDLYSSYVYQSMAMYYERDDVALCGFSKFFKQQSDIEKGQAEKLMEYQNKRGGRIVLQTVQKPENDEWGSGLEGMQMAVSLEKSINQSLLELYGVAEKHGDEHLGDFIEDHFLGKQVDTLKAMSDYVTQLTNVGPGLGEFQFDQKLQGAEM
ncbi:soma ferritin-like [Mya arenaria]|uniref:soma ferritin-like n=1 Tax=Mya arenaria TaxID=6604 RepID=UPI0022E792DE|nr:soma ferritin-like [Mya arenaria]